jgi:fatty-acyl-CoA synthase
MFYQMFEKHAAKQPSKIAVAEKSRSITYGELDAMIGRVAQNLSNIGAKEGTRIIVCFSNNIEYVALYFAVARLGAVIIPLTTTLTDDEIQTFCRAAKSDFILVEDKYVQKFTFPPSAEVRGRLITETTPGINLGDIYKDPGKKFVGTSADLSQHDFLVQYTSGTTGLPKGIIQKQTNHVHRMLGWAETAELTANDKTLCILSVTHAYGADVISWPALTTGQTLHLLEIDDKDPTRIAQLIDSEGITVFGHLPWFYQELVDTPGIGRFDLSTLKVAMIGAVPLPRQVAVKFFELFKVQVNNSYGLTETGCICSNLFKTGKEDVLSVGRIIKGVEYKIRDCDLGVENAGELVVRSKAFADRYSAESGVEMYRDGWFHTGDLVREGDDHCIHPLARLSEVIFTPEGTILPFAVEESLMGLKAVAEVAVVPLDGSGGIFIVPANDSLSEAEVRRHLDKVAPKFKHIKHVKFMPGFPKSVTGKISKAKLAV